ncbi:hypothetical protein MXB_3118, partial [Myxobolus squamalis]
IFFLLKIQNCALHFLNDINLAHSKIQKNVSKNNVNDLGKVSYLEEYSKNLNSEDMLLFLDDWKQTYNAQKENLYFLIDNNFKKPYYENALHGNAPSNMPLIDMIDLHLYQILNLEKMRQKLRVEKFHEALEEYVEKVIYFNQYPPTCEDREIILCKIKYSCGFGCKMHHLLYCLALALAEGKIMVAEGKEWSIFNSKKALFLPLNVFCKNGKYTSKSKITIISNSSPKIQQLYFPNAVPSEIFLKILTFHTNPFLWWIGQLTKFLFRQNAKTKNFLDMRNQLTSPIVGLHVRRTDKLKLEAKYYDAKEYMFWVELFFRKIELKNKKIKRRVYVATDDIHLIKELRNQFCKNCKIKATI